MWYHSRKTLVTLIFILGGLIITLIVSLAICQNVSCSAIAATSRKEIKRESEETPQAGEDVITEVFQDASESEEEDYIPNPMFSQKFEENGIVITVELTECKNKDLIPSFYNEIHPYDVSIPIYAFTDENGETQYRGYVKRQFNQGSAILKRDAGFVPVEIVVDGNGFAAKIKSKDVIDVWNERPGLVKVEMPAWSAIPSEYKFVSDHVFAYTTEEGETINCVYGSFDGIEYFFWQCDENGNAILGALKVGR